MNTNRAEVSVIDVALIRSTHPLAQPMLSLTSAEGPVTEHVVMSVGQARALSYVLRRLIDMTKGNGR
ncbi:hypothetical protein [Micromonospora sp. RTP1Z1]|uniref:hypothetical protein n=1 Tax=Micromonospora sp. RTP1Z1 TaxID=2994043 RepID=UPI0029C99216|nr:hypothetical protein [Micromonospora sp. RTP1Z1]